MCNFITGKPGWRGVFLPAPVPHWPALVSSRGAWPLPSARLPRLEPSAPDGTPCGEGSRVWGSRQRALRLAGNGCAVALFLLTLKVVTVPHVNVK